MNKKQSSLRENINKFLPKFMKELKQLMINFLKMDIRLRNLSKNINKLKKKSI